MAECSEGDSRWLSIKRRDIGHQTMRLLRLGNANVKENPFNFRLRAVVDES